MHDIGILFFGGGRGVERKSQWVWNSTFFRSDSQTAIPFDFGIIYIEDNSERILVSSSHLQRFPKFYEACVRRFEYKSNDPNLIRVQTLALLPKIVLSNMMKLSEFVRTFSIFLLFVARSFVFLSSNVNFRSLADRYLAKRIKNTHRFVWNENRSRACRKIHFTWLFRVARFTHPRQQW